MKEAVTIPVITSSGAGKVEHFSDLFEVIQAEAAFSSSIFHGKGTQIASIKEHFREKDQNNPYKIWFS